MDLVPLDGPFERPRAVAWIEAGSGQMIDHCVVERNLNAAKTQSLAAKHVVVRPDGQMVTVSPRLMVPDTI